MRVLGAGHATKIDRLVRKLEFGLVSTLSLCPYVLYCKSFEGTSTRLVVGVERIVRVVLRAFGYRELYDSSEEMYLR